MRKICEKNSVQVTKWLLTALTLSVAALLIAQCAGLYLQGVSPENVMGKGVYLHDIYSRELVAERLGDILWVLVLWGLALAAAVTVKHLCPEEKKERITIPLENRLELLSRRVSPTPAMKMERHRRRTAAAVVSVICAGCAVGVGLYVFDVSHFASRELEPVMGAMLLHTVPWVILAFASLMVLTKFQADSMEREFQAAAKAEKSEPKPQAKRRAFISPHLLRRVLYVVAVLLFLIGIVNGGMQDVLVKAINICTECIGLG